MKLPGISNCSPWAALPNPWICSTKLKNVIMDQISLHEAARNKQLKAHCPAVWWMPYRQTSPRLSPNLPQSRSGHRLHSQTLRFELRNVIVNWTSLREAAKKKQLEGSTPCSAVDALSPDQTPTYRRTCPGAGLAMGWIPKPLDLHNKTKQYHGLNVLATTCQE